MKNIQENFENSYNRATQAFETGDYMTCCLMIVYKFYEMYYYNNVQDDVNAVVVRALEKASAKPWDEAAPILHAAMDNIMEGELEPDDDDDEEGYVPDDAGYAANDAARNATSGTSHATGRWNDGVRAEGAGVAATASCRTGEYGRLYVESTTVSRHLYGERSATIMKFNDYGTEYF